MIETEEKEYIPVETQATQKDVHETAANLLSALFHPFLVPLYAYVLMFSFTYLNIMPIPYISFVLSIVITFTLITPMLFIGLYKWMNKWDLKVLSERKKRLIPYVLTLMSYATCLITMHKMHFPHYFSSIIMASFVCRTR